MIDAERHVRITAGLAGHSARIIDVTSGEELRDVEAIEIKMRADNVTWALLHRVEVVHVDDLDVEALIAPNR